MYSLQGLLNPREEGAREVREASPLETSRLEPSTVVDAPLKPSKPSQPRYYAHYISWTGLHEPHPGCPNSLSCLVDNLDTAPTDQIETLVRCAILGSGDEGHLSIDEIEAALKGKYPFYKSEDREDDLKYSITYLLATSPAFVRHINNGQISWGVTDVHAHNERPALAIHSPPQSARAYAKSPSIGAPPSSATSSYASSRPTYSEESLDSPRSDTTPFGALASDLDVVQPPLSPPRVSNSGPPGAYIGAPLLHVDDHGQHPPHPDCPSALSCLQDTNDKPSYTLPIIIRAAILGSASGRLTITDIYGVIIRKYPHFATLPPDDSWKQSVRHHLSLSNRFVKVVRRANEPGRGAYWTVDLEAPPGTKRPRKRSRKEQDGPPRPRGRPRTVYDHPVGYDPDYDKPIPLPALAPPPNVSRNDWEMDEDGSYDEDEDDRGNAQTGPLHAARAGYMPPATPRLYPVHWAYAKGTHGRVTTYGFGGGWNGRWNSSYITQLYIHM
ncbi:unnamed protein product [Peniophora sp. CBMAI 1063]|nr:unnamed protein product [Peniophora sp. CBMAI 1063]